MPFRVAFMGAIFPSVRYQYRKDLWVLGKLIQHGSTSSGSTLSFTDVPEWLQGGRATIIGPQPRTCAWRESKQLLRDSGEPIKQELGELEAYLNEHSLSDWREVLDHKQSSELYTGCVSYLKGHGVGEAEAKGRAREYVAESNPEPLERNSISECVPTSDVTLQTTHVAPVALCPNLCVNNSTYFP